MTEHAIPRSVPGPSAAPAPRPTALWGEGAAAASRVGSAWLVAALLGCLVLLGAGLRFHDLERNTIGHIEVVNPGIRLPYGLASPGPRHDLQETMASIIIEGETHPPGYYVLMLAWTHLTGTDEQALRLPSVVFGVGSIVATFAIAFLLRGQWTALLAAAMVALNGHQILWSQAAKNYAMACFFGLLSTLLLLLAARGGRHQRLFQVLYVAATLVGLATAHFLWAVLLVHALWVLLTDLSKGKMLTGLLRTEILVVTLGSPLLALAAIQSRRDFYLSDAPWERLFHFLHFGSLFNPDLFAIPVRSVPIGVSGILVSATLAFLIYGVYDLHARKPGFDRRDSLDTGPSLVLIAAAGVLAVVIMARLGKYSFPWLDQRTGYLLIGAIAIPQLLLTAALLAARAERLGRWVLPLQTRFGAFPLLGLLPVALGILPVALLAAVSPVVPLLSADALVIYSPYLLIAVAVGVVALAQKHRGFLLAVPVLAIVFALSANYYQSVVLHPTDYRGLSNQWIPQIQPSDRIFVHRHFATTPIFYYLPSDRYEYVGSGYSESIAEKPDTRVWVLSFDGVPVPDEIQDALRGYEVRGVLKALRIRTELYVRSGATP